MLLLLNASYHIIGLYSTLASLDALIYHRCGSKVCVSLIQNANGQSSNVSNPMQNIKKNNAEQTYRQNGEIHSL